MSGETLIVLIGLVMILAILIFRFIIIPADRKRNYEQGRKFALDVLENKLGPVAERIDFLHECIQESRDMDEYNEFDQGISDVLKERKSK